MSLKRPLTKKEKEVRRLLSRPRLRFEKSSALLAAIEKSAARKAEAERLPTTASGTIMIDGTIFAGFSPEGKPLFTTPADAPVALSFNEAAAYAKNLKAHGHGDWRVPTLKELDVLCTNRYQGALTDTFNKSDAYPLEWYWSSTSNSPHSGWAQCFNTNMYDDDENMDSFSREVKFSVRCVRS